VTEIHGTAARGFGAAADAYERARPGYPDEALDFVVSSIGAGRVLDLAAGTGKLTRALVARGLDVVAVEPIAEMRARLVDVLPGVQALDGTAEAIPLDDEGVSTVTVAQAFHWFRFDDAIAEIARVLEPGGRLVLIWNARDERVPWVKRITEIIDPYEGDDMSVHRWRRGKWRDPVFSSSLLRFIEQRDFEHGQPMDAEMLVERVLSTSFISVLEPDEKHAVLDAVRRLAESDPALAGRATFDFPYVCEVYIFEQM